MESFVFNNFKYKLINGEVPKNDTWYFWPVNKNFVNDFGDNLKYFKTSADFSAFSPAIVYNGTDEKPGWKNTPDYWNNNYLTTLYEVDYKYTPMSNTDVATEPEYVSYETREFFVSRYPTQRYLVEKMFFNDSPGNKFFRPIAEVKDINGNHKEYIGKGFYYVRTAEELRWCANKVNGNTYDNTINIVLGDNIGTDLGADSTEEEPNEYNILKQPGLKIIDFSIGSNPAQPYEGIFFGNGFRFRNIRLLCSNNVNGIIGYLGPDGIIDSVDIYDNIVLECNKEITLNHLVNQGTDVAAGFLCGKNNGTISNVRLKANVIVNKFKPRMYSVYNKGNEFDESETSKTVDAYVYYPDYLCYNNAGNIVPYVGYFNEGVFATFSGYSKQTDRIFTYWNTDMQSYDTEVKVLEEGIASSPQEWYYWYGLPAPSGGYIMHYTAPANRANVLFYDGGMFAQTNYAYNEYISKQFKSATISTLGLLIWDNNDPINGGASLMNAHYFNKSIKMQQQNRVAYYVSPIVGVNNKTIDNVVADSDIYLSGTFVGFMGGIVGKQTKGVVKNVTVKTTVNDMLTKKALTDEQMPYLDRYTYYLRDYIDKTPYWFPQRSIKNIGGVIGSLIVGDVSATELNNVKSVFNNNNSVIYKTINGQEEVEYDDYYFLNRYAGIAPMIEYNSSNVSDIWNRNDDGVLYDDVNNPMSRSIFIKNSIFAYNEVISGDTTETSVARYKPYDCRMQKPEGFYWMLGGSAPTFAEIKPTYLAIPSLTETVFLNNGSAMSGTNIGTTARFGLFTMDQHLAAPLTDPNYWCINLERDLPGIQNTVDYSTLGNDHGKLSPAADDLKACGFAGGVVDRLNKTYGVNFDINVTNIAGKLVNWENNYIIASTDRPISNPFTATLVPEYANITAARCQVKDGSIVVNADISCPDFISKADTTYAGMDAVAITGNYNGNKYLTTYPYFGSDLYIIPNEETIAQNRVSNTRDTIDPDSYNRVILISNELPTDSWETNDGDWDPFYSTHNLGLTVNQVNISILAEAFKYQPFTTEPIPAGRFTELYNITVYNKENYETPVTTISNEFPGLGSNNIIKLTDKFDNYKTSDAYKMFEYAEYAFVYYTDYTREGSDSCYVWFVIPFETKPLTHYWYNPNGDKVYTKAYPPYNTFKAFYFIADKDGSRESGTHHIAQVYPMGTLTFKNTVIEGNTFYFLGYSNLSTGEVNWGSKNTQPALTTRPLTGYRWDTYNGVKMFQLATDPSQGTFDVSLAATGYVNTTAKIGDDDWITATDDNRYPCYADYDDDPDDECVMSAVPLLNIDEAHWNWQNYLVDYKSETDTFDGKDAYKYDYTMYGELSLLNEVYDGDLTRGGEGTYTPPEPWYMLNKKGKFRNALLESSPLDYTGITISDSSIINWDNTINDALKPDYALDPSLDLTENISKAKNDEQEDVDFYKFTYEKFVTSRFAINGLPVNVEYDTIDDKAGFWFYNADNEKYLKPSDGKTNYLPNVFNIGKTLNQESILTNLKYADDRTLVISAFSADDFEGVYVTDSNKNPVMYIDVGLGECSEGTTWSFSALPSREIKTDDINKLETRNDIRGLMLEID